MKPTFHSTFVSKGGFALFLLVLTTTATNCNARSSHHHQQQDDELSRQTTSFGWSRLAQISNQQQIVDAPSNADYEEYTRKSAYDYGEGNPSYRLKNGLPSPAPPPPTTKVYERVVLEGSKISISCPHYTPTIAPAETLFAKIQRISNLNEHKQPRPLRRHKENGGEAVVAEEITALNSNSELRVKWFRNHVPLQNLNHLHHQSRQAQRESSSLYAAYDESQASASLFEETTTFATAANTKITGLIRTTELSQTTVPATLVDKQQWQTEQRNLLKTSVEAERSVGSLTTESVNELAAGDRKPTNMPELQHGHGGRQSWQQPWYVNKFGELVINEASRYFAGKYTCLVEGKQSEVLLDVLLDSQVAVKRPEQAYRIEEETVMSVSDGPDVSSSKVLASETSTLASTRPKITASYATEGGNNSNEPVLNLSNEGRVGGEKAREKTGSRLTVDEEKDNSESETSVVTREIEEPNRSLTSLHRVASLTEQQQQQLPEPTPDSTTTTDWRGGIQETSEHSLVDKNLSEIELYSIKTLGDVVPSTGSSEQWQFLLLSTAPPPQPSIEADYVLGGDGNNYKAAKGKVESTLSVPSASNATEIISDLRSYMFPRKHLTQTYSIHLVKSEAILMSELKSFPGFLYTKQQLHCPIAFSQRELKREYFQPLILALCPKTHSQKGYANLADGNKHELQRRELQCYHLAERLISQLTRNCSTSVLDLVWFKDGKLLEFDANGKGRDKELNVKVIDSLEQFNTTASESTSNSSSARFDQSNIESSSVSLSSSQFAKLQRPRWTCPIFSGRTLEIDGVRRDSAGRYTCAFRLSIAKLEEIVLRQPANTNASNSGSKRNPGSFLSFLNCSQPPAHDNDTSSCDEHDQAPIQSGFHSAAKHYKSWNKNARRNSHHQQQKQQQSLRTIEAQIETNASKTIRGNSNGSGSTTVASNLSSDHRDHYQGRINLTHNGGARSLSKRIAILKSILRGEPEREQSLNYIGRTLSRLQIPLEAAATTMIQTFSLLVTERAANSCDLWSTIAEAGNAYTRRKLADFKRLRRSVAVDRVRQRIANRRSASIYSSSVSENKFKNVRRDKSSTVLAVQGRFATAPMAVPTTDGSDVAAGAAFEEQKAVASAELQTLKTRPIKRLNVNIDGSNRQLSSGGGPIDHWNAIEEYSMNERRPTDQYQSAGHHDDYEDDYRHEDDDVISSSGGRSSKSRVGYDISVGDKQNAGPIDERSERNEQKDERKKATLNALHLMSDNNGSSETLVFTDYQQGYNLLLNNADELESDIETSPADIDQTKSNSGTRSNANSREASSISSSESGGHYRHRGSHLQNRAAVSTGVAVAFARTPFNYANEANEKLGSHDERSTGSSNPATGASASASDEASSQRSSAGGSSASSLARDLESDRQRFNTMIEAIHDHSLADAETKDLITQRNSANHSVGYTAESSAGQRPTLVGLESGEFQTNGHPMVIDDQQHKVAWPIIDGDLVGERPATRRGYVATNIVSDGGSDRVLGAKASSASAYFEQRGSRQFDDQDDTGNKDFEADGQADAGIGGNSNEESNRRSRRSRRVNRVGRQEATELPDRGDETSSQAAAGRAVKASHFTGISSSDSDNFGRLLTSLAGRDRRKSTSAAKSDVKSYVAPAGFTGARLSWPARAIDEKAKDKRQDPLQGNKLLPLTIGDSGGGCGDQSSSWQGNEGSSGGSGSIANNPKSRSKDIEQNHNDQDDDDSNDGTSQLNGPATQYSAPDSQFLIDVQTESTGEAESRKVSSTNQSALPMLEAGQNRNFVAIQQITSAEFAGASSQKLGKEAVALLREAPSSFENSSFNDDDNQRISISSAFAAASIDQVPIFSDDRLDETLMWTAGQYLYMHMRALATSPIFGVEVDVEWSNERTNGSTDIDLSDVVNPTDYAAAPLTASGGSGEWQAREQIHYAPPRLHDAAPFATIDVISGQSLTLQCTAQALGRLPEVKWYKRIHTIPLRLKSLVKMVRRIGHDLYWPLSELDLLSDDSSKRSFVCSQTTTIFDNLTNQTFTMVNSLQLSQYNDVIEPEIVRSNSLTAGGDYNLYACIVDADVRHNYATLGVHLRQAPRKIPPEISKRLHARSAVLTKSSEPSSATPHMRLIRANKVIDHRQQTYTNYDLYREARKLQFPMKDYWVPIQNESHLKREIVESPLTPALLSLMIGFVCSSLLALLYLTFRSYRSLTNFHMDFDADEPLADSINLSINPQCELIAYQGSNFQEQSNEQGNSQPICSCHFEPNSNDDSHSLTTSAVMMIEDGSTLYNPENVIYTKFDHDISEIYPHRSSPMPPTFRYDTCSPPYRLYPYSNLHPQVPHEASDIWPQSHASFYEEPALNLEAH